MFVYVAAYGGTLAAENALAAAGRVYDTRAIPRVTFTDPQIASTGLTEVQASELAAADGYDVAVSTLPMAQVHIDPELPAMGASPVIKHTMCTVVAGNRLPQVVRAIR